MLPPPDRVGRLSRRDRSDAEVLRDVDGVLVAVLDPEARDGCDDEAER
jgi:hypothetical protein